MYYDLDEILADAEVIPCRFNMTVPGLGYLDGNPGEAIDKGTKLELPLWLAEVLAVCELSEQSQTSFIDLANPEFASSKVLNAVKTGPLAIDLLAILPNFYTLCEKWASMFNDEQLIEIVQTLLTERASEINNHACNAKSGNSTFLQSLDEFEKKLYHDTAKNHRLVREWLRS